MVRITGTPGPTQRLSDAIWIPAAIDSSTGRVACSAGASAASTLAASWGLTAMTTSAQPAMAA
jgi:hypothetical protein